MCEYLQMFQFPCQFHHPQRPLDVALNGLVQSGVEVDASRTVDDNMAGLNQLLFYFFHQAESRLMQVSLSKYSLGYMGWTLL